MFLKKTLTFIVEGLSEPMNIKNYLSFCLKLSRRFITKAKFGGVFVNGMCVHMRASVKNGDTVKIEVPEEIGSTISPLDIPLDIIYEDEHILAINKPKSMPVHPCRGNSLPTLAEGVMNYLGEGFTFRALNRLDKDTSGIVVVAKNSYSAGILGKEMKNGRFLKKYVAVVCGIPKDEHGFIDAPIERVSQGNIKREVRDDGKHALTEYRVIGKYGNACSLCEITLHTGRTHQIRVHMSHIGHPLYADSLYGTAVPSETYKLHCTEISFMKPQGEMITLKSNPDFCV